MSLGTFGVKREHGDKGKTTFSGKYKVILDFSNAKREKTNIQGYLVFLDADGGGQEGVLGFNEIDTAARKSASFGLKKLTVLIVRVENTIYSLNYAVSIRPEQE